MNRAVTIRCVICELEVTGVRDSAGVVRPSDRSRPEPSASVEDGYCIRHSVTSSRPTPAEPEKEKE